METLRVYPNKDQEKVIVAFLESLEIPFDRGEALPEHVLKGIQKGLEDIESGSKMTFKEFQTRQPYAK